MLFSSYIFILLFLPTVFCGYFLLSKKSYIASQFWLVVCSLFFYSWWNIYYLPIILSSICFNFYFARYLNKNLGTFSAQRKNILIFSICTNLLLLGYFKYYNFFLSNINLLVNEEYAFVNIALPLAISFFTFQQIAFLVDSYNNKIKEYNFLNYSVFITFFPQLIAGPIVHHGEMMFQFKSLNNKLLNYRNILSGIFIFSIGLFKKVVIADSLSTWVSAGFDISQTLTFFEGWAISLAYTFQLYFDFSGYVDMAIGLGLLFNIKLPINFNSPYKSLNIQEFWRRWHITLSRFLRDYIYIPLGGNRGSFLKMNLNLLATFLIGGLWHGAGWTFIFWGFLHGLALVFHRLWSLTNVHLWGWLSWFITFNFVNVTWIFFRANSWDDAIKIINAMFDYKSLIEGLNHIYNFINSNELHHLINISPNIKANLSLLLWIALSFVITLFFKNSIKHINYPETLKSEKVTSIKLLYYSIMFLISLAAISLQPYSEFIYFNF